MIILLLHSRADTSKIGHMNSKNLKNPWPKYGWLEEAIKILF